VSLSLVSSGCAPCRQAHGTATSERDTARPRSDGSEVPPSGHCSPAHPLTSHGAGRSALRASSGVRPSRRGQPLDQTTHVVHGAGHYSTRFPAPPGYAGRETIYSLGSAPASDATYGPPSGWRPPASANGEVPALGPRTTVGRAPENHRLLLRRIEPRSAGASSATPLTTARAPPLIDGADPPRHPGQAPP